MEGADVVVDAMTRVLVVGLLLTTKAVVVIADLTSSSAPINAAETMLAPDEKKSLL